MPGTFGECVIRGGTVKAQEQDISCRYVETSTIRTYMSAITECGEEVYFDAWGETRSGVITYPFEPGQTEILPEVVDKGIPETPIPCLDAPDDGGA